MTVKLHDDPLPLRIDERGAVRVGKSNVTLDLVVEQFEAGNSPEAICDGYDTLQLADVYQIIAFYLRHTDDVKTYLTEQRLKAEEIWREIQTRQTPRPNFREELLSRHAKMGAENASVPD